MNFSYYDNSVHKNFISYRTELIQKENCEVLNFISMKQVNQESDRRAMVLFHAFDYQVTQISQVCCAWDH